MSNPFYGATGNPLNSVRAVAATVRYEFALIQTAFDSVKESFDGVTNTFSTKGNISGQTWAGDHDFSAGTLRVPTLPYGASGSYAVSYDALNAAIFASANLPGQADKSGCSLWTNGTLPVWDRRRVPQVVVITATQTWSPPVNCWAEVIVQGGGASGPAGSNSQPGGPGGGTAIKFLQLLASVTYTATVGSGGAATTASTGNAGGTSSFSGAGITTITANGGPSVGNSGGVGGTATGGDINITGGPSCLGTSNISYSSPLSGASYFNPGGTMLGTDGVNFGAGAGNTYGLSTGKAGYQGVVIIKY